MGSLGRWPVGACGRARLCSACEPADQLRCIEVVDRRTGDTANAAATHGSTLSVMEDGECRLRMAARVVAAYTVAARRGWVGGYQEVLIAPIAGMARKIGLTLNSICTDWGVVEN